MVLVYLFFLHFPRSESDSEEEEEEEELPLLSEEEMNRLGAKLVKAEIMGNAVSTWCYSLSLCRAEYEMICLFPWPHNLVSRNDLLFLKRK